MGKTGTGPRIGWRAKTGASMAAIGAATLLIAFFTLSAGAKPGEYVSNLSAVQGQTPMPTTQTAVTESCNGVAPTPGSRESVTQKVIDTTASNSFTPGGTVHWKISYNQTNSGNSFDIQDCIVEFLYGSPPNAHIPAMLALIANPAPAGNGQIVPTSGSTPDILGWDGEALDTAEWSWAKDVALPGFFDLTWTIPADTPPGLICNYSKDTGGSTTGGGENRKAGACFAISSFQGPHTTLTDVANPSSGLATLNVTFTYTEQNDGNVPISGVELTHKINGSPASTPAYQSGDTSNVGVLDPGETWVFTATAAFASSGTYTDAATATGHLATGASVPDETAQATVTVTTPLVTTPPLVIPTTTTTTSTTTTTTTTSTTLAPLVVPPTTQPPQVLGEVVTKPTLPFTGSNTGVLAMTGGLLLLVGGLLLWAADRRFAEARVIER